MVMSTTMAPKPYSTRYTKLYTPEAASTSLMRRDREHTGRHEQRPAPGRAAVSADAAR